MPYMRLVVQATLLYAQLHATERVEQRVQFPPGSTSPSIDGRITGDTILGYLLWAKAGQTIRVTRDTDNSAAYFRYITPPRCPDFRWLNARRPCNFPGRQQGEKDGTR